MATSYFTQPRITLHLLGMAKIKKIHPLETVVRISRMGALPHDRQKRRTAQLLWNAGSFSKFSVWNYLMPQWFSYS